MKKAKPPALTEPTEEVSYSKQATEELRKRLPGKINISPSYGPDGMAFRVSIEDLSSGVNVVTAELSAEDFGRALSTIVPCTYRVMGQAFVGKRRENKIETIFVPRGIRRDRYGTVDPDDPLLLQCLKPYEVDGWAASTSDVTNRHRFQYEVEGFAKTQLALKVGLEDVEGDVVEVAFHRYVD